MWWFARHQLRRRWREVVGLAVLVGLAGGLVLATAAGARRTDDVFDRYVGETAARDATVQIDEEPAEPILTAVERLPSVERSGRTSIFPAAPVDGPETEIDLAIFASPDGRWATDVDRPLVVQGRMPDPDSTREVIVNELAAEQAELTVGDRLTVATFTPAELESVFFGGEFTGFNGPTVDLVVVGVGRQANDLQGSDTTAGGVLIGSPALHDVLAGDAGGLTGMLAVDLVPGASVAELRDQVREIVGPQAEFDVRSSDEEFAGSTRDAAEVLGQALWAFAAAAAVATAVAVGGTLSRQYARERASRPLLAALGFDRRQQATALLAAPAVGLVVGTTAAVVVAVLASGRFPVSVARRVEPNPGMEIDWVVLGAGSLVLLATGVMWLLVIARRDGRRSTATANGRSRRTTSLVLPPAAAIGMRHAFDTRADGRPVPARAALVAATLGFLGLVAATVVVHSLDELAADPDRYGWTWAAEPDVFSDDPTDVFAEVSATEGVDAVALRHAARMELGGVVVEAVAFEPFEGAIDPPVRAGRLPAAETEVALGQHTAEELGVDLGDRVPALETDGSPGEVTVVGITVLAPVESTDPAAGAVLTPAGLERHRRSDGFTAMLIDYAAGADVAAVESSLEERELASFSGYSHPRLPGGLENLRRAMPIVGGLGAFFAVLGVVAVGHAVVVGARRRRDELTTLRALGMRRGQIRSIVTLNAVATVGFGLLVGVPLGLVTGRLAWDLVIGSHGVIDGPSVPVLALLALVPGALLVALVASSWPASQAARTPASARTE